MMFYVEDNRKMILLRDQYLKKLYEIDLEGSSQLLKTLREYFIQGGNILQTSKNLFIHRNTLQYRLERIETIIMMDINDFNVKRDFYNAFMILDMFPFE
jgi:DNA-binding PucR family transcriptional regulator